MNKLLSALVLTFLGFSLHLQAQSAKTLSVSNGFNFNTQNGYVVTIPIVYSYVNNGGEIYLQARLDMAAARMDGYVYKGEMFRESDLEGTAMSRWRDHCGSLDLNFFIACAGEGAFNTVTNVGLRVDRSNSYVSVAQNVDWSKVEANARLRILNNCEASLQTNGIQVRNSDVERQIEDAIVKRKAESLLFKADQKYGFADTPAEWREVLKMYKDVYKLDSRNQRAINRINDLEGKLHNYQKELMGAAENIRVNAKTSQDYLRAAEAYDKLLQEYPDNRDAPSLAQAMRSKAKEVEGQADKSSQAGGSANSESNSNNTASGGERNSAGNSSANSSSASESSSSNSRSSSSSSSSSSSRSSSSSSSSGASDGNRGKNGGSASSGSSSSTSQQSEYEQMEQKMRQDAARKRQEQEAMGQLGAAALLVHYFIGKAIYSGIGSDSEENINRGPGNRIGFGVGYQLVPSDESAAIELGISLDYWAYHSKQAGLAAGLEFFGGHGIIFDQFTAGAGFKAQGFIGAPHLQVYGSYQMGVRAINWTGDDLPWDDLYYSRFSLGPQFRFYPDYRDWSTLRVLGLFERPLSEIEPRLWESNPQSSFFRQTPESGVFTNYSVGLRAEWTKRNRISVGAEALFSANNALNNRYMLYVHRRVDLFPNSALRLRNSAKAIYAINNFEGSYVSTMQTTFAWVQNDSLGTFESDPIMGMRPIGYHYVWKLFGKLGLQLGMEADINFGRYMNPTNGNRQLLGRVGAVAPLTLRYHIPTTFVRYHLEGGYSYAYTFYEDQEGQNDGFLEPGRTNFRLGLGAAFPGSMSNHSISLTYERSISPHYIQLAETPGLLLPVNNLRLHTISLQIAFQL